MFLTKSMIIKIYLFVSSITYFHNSICRSSSEYKFLDIIPMQKYNAKLGHEILVHHDVTDGAYKAAEG